jgi:hypothetical protein
MVQKDTSQQKSEQNDENVELDCGSGGRLELMPLIGTPMIWPCAIKSLAWAFERGSPGLTPADFMADISTCFE